jgi:hypothetical protein
MDGKNDNLSLETRYNNGTKLDGIKILYNALNWVFFDPFFCLGRQQPCKRCVCKAVLLKIGGGGFISPFAIHYHLNKKPILTFA